MDYDIVIVRYGELGLKSEPIRRRYESLLIRNIRAMLVSREIHFEG